MRYLLSSLGSLFLAVVLTACPQGSGTPCDGPGDCSAGFRCVDGTCEEASGSGRREDAGKRDAGVALCETADGRFQFLHSPDDQLNCPPSTFLITDGPGNVGISHNGHGWRVLPSKALAAPASVRIQEPQGFVSGDVDRYFIWHRTSPVEDWIRGETSYTDRYFSSDSAASGDFMLARDGEALPDAGGSLDFDGGLTDSGLFDGGPTDIPLPTPDVPWPDFGFADVGVLDFGGAQDIGAGDAGAPDIPMPDHRSFDMGIFDGGPEAGGRDYGPDSGPPPSDWYSGCQDRQCLEGMICAELVVPIQGVHTSFCTGDCSYASDCPQGNCCHQPAGQETGICRFDLECMNIEDDLRPYVRPCGGQDDCPRSGTCSFNACHPGELPGFEAPQPAEPGQECSGPASCAAVEGRQVNCIFRAFENVLIGHGSWHTAAAPFEGQCTWICEDDDDCAGIEGTACREVVPHPDTPEGYPTRACVPVGWIPIPQREIGTPCPRDQMAFCGRDRQCLPSPSNEQLSYCTVPCGENPDICGEGNCCIHMLPGRQCENDADCGGLGFVCVDGNCRNDEGRMCGVGADCQ